VKIDDNLLNFDFDNRFGLGASKSKSKPLSDE